MEWRSRKEEGGAVGTEVDAEVREERTLEAKCAWSLLGILSLPRTDVGEESAVRSIGSTESSGADFGRSWSESRPVRSMISRRMSECSPSLGRLAEDGLLKALGLLRSLFLNSGLKK